VWVIAQSSTRPTAPDNSQSNQPTSASQQPDAQEKAPAAADRSAQSLQGCITKVGAGYSLTDNSGKTYQLAGDTSKLADEVGHYDQVWGKQEGSTSGAAASSGAPATFTVTKVKVVSTTCPSK
jgi:hypothetical protein